MVICETLAAQSNIADMVNCFVGGLFGMDYTLFAIFTLFFIALIAYKAKLDFTIALTFAWGSVYFFNMLSGGSDILNLIFALLTIGIGVKIARSVISYFN